MRTFRTIFASMVLAACEPAGDYGATEPNVLDMLEAGDNRVCGLAEVENTVLSGLAQSLDKDLPEDSFVKFIRSRNLIDFEAASMTGKNTEIREVTCSATLRTAEGSYEVSYKVRPSSEEQNGYVVWFDIEDDVEALAFMNELSLVIEQFKSHEDPAPSRQADPAPVELGPEADANLATEFGMTPDELRGDTNNISEDVEAVPYE